LLSPFALLFLFLVLVVPEHLPTAATCQSMSLAGGRCDND